MSLKTKKEMIQHIEKLGRSLTAYHYGGKSETIGNAVLNHKNPLNFENTYLPWQLEFEQMKAIRETNRSLSQSLEFLAVFQGYDFPGVVLHTCFGTMAIPQGAISYEDADIFQNICDQIEWDRVEYMIDDMEDVEDIGDQIRAIISGQRIIEIEFNETPEEWEAGQL